MQENDDDQHDQQDGFEQRVDDRHDGFAREQGRVVNDAVINTGREVLLEFLQLRPHRVGRVDGIRPRKLKDHERGGGLAAELRRNRVVARSQFDSRHILDARDLALRPLLDDDFAELLFVEQPPLCADGELEILAGGDRRLADGAGGHLEVLLSDGADGIAGRHVARGELFRVKPDAHGVIARPENCDISDTLNAGELVLHLQEGVVAEVKLVARAVRRNEMRHHREVGRSLRRGHAETAHFFRQLR